MKYFLTSFLICTFGLAAEPPPHTRPIYTLGTIEMWSDWMPTGIPMDTKQLCTDVCAYYNHLNVPRGMWGRLVEAEPVGLKYRGLADGSLQQRLFCRLRVWVLTPEMR